MNKKNLSTLLLSSLLITAFSASLNKSFAQSLTRKAYFVATANNNFSSEGYLATSVGQGGTFGTASFDAEAYKQFYVSGAMSGPKPVGYALMCSVHVFNFSLTTQNITRAKINFHSTFMAQSATGTAHVKHLDIRAVGHHATKWFTNNHWPSAYLLVPISKSNPINASNNEGIQFSTSGPASPSSPNLVGTLGGGWNYYRPTIFDSNFSTNGASSILIPPEHMLILFSRTWAPAAVPQINDLVYGASEPLTDIKTYNFCSGSIEVADSPQTSDPVVTNSSGQTSRQTHGFVTATGALEYIADSSSNPLLQYGMPSDGGILDAYISEGNARAELNLGITNRPSYNCGMNGSQCSGAIAPGCVINGLQFLAKDLSGLSIPGPPVLYPDYIFDTTFSFGPIGVYAQAGCQVDAAGSNTSGGAMFPQHVGTVPFFIEGGLPF